jgi:hypothetical protein
MLKLPNSVGHVLFGLLLGVPIALATASPLVGWLAQSFYWLGRERRDRETSAGLNPFTEWYKGWDIWNWTADNRTDLLAPVIVNGIIALAGWALLKHLHGHA